MAHRSVSRVVHALVTLEGEGFLVHRPFPTPQLDDIDPFLLLDRMGPVTLASGEAKGTCWRAASSTKTPAVIAAN
jgi:redox-sensitive bicupin YhaK (pirin superfamily)